MSPSNNKGELVRLYKDGSAEIVQMNQTNFIPWSQKQNLGTESLGGCSVVAIGGQLAGIISHSDATLGSVEKGMRDLNELYTTAKQKSWFPETPQCWVAFPEHDGKCDEYNLHYIQERLRRWGLNPVIKKYDSEDREEIPGQGSCFLKGDTAGKECAKFYYEDKEVR